MLAVSLDNKPIVFVLTIGLVALSAMLYGSLGGELIPPLSQGEFSFEIRFSEGTPLDLTDRAFKSIEDEVGEITGVQTVFTSVGGSSANQFSQSALEENVGQIFILMEDREDRVAEQSTIAGVRQILSGYPDASYTFSRPTLFSFKTAIEVEVYAFDLEDQRRAAESVVQRLEAIPGLSDIQSTTKLGSPEIQVRFDRERLARLGLDETRIGEILRNKIRGDVASRYREEDKQIEILVRAEESNRDTIADLRTLVINDRGNSQNNASGQNTGRSGVTGSGSAAGGPSNPVRNPTGTNPTNAAAGNQQTGQAAAGQQQQTQQPATVPIPLGSRRRHPDCSRPSRGTAYSVTACRRHIGKSGGPRPQQRFRRYSRGAASPAWATASHHDRWPSRAERRSRGIVQESPIRSRARRLPCLSRDGLAVRIANAPPSSSCSPCRWRWSASSSPLL